MITTTTRISISVKPAALRLPLTALFLGVPVADVRVDAFAAGLAVRAEREQVEVAAARAGIEVLVLVAPGILADALHVAARAPVADGRVARLLDECAQALVGARVLRVVEAVHGERRLDRLDVLLGFGDARFFHLVHDLRNDHGREQADDDHDDHDLDESEAARGLTRWKLAAA